MSPYRIPDAIEPSPAPEIDERSIVKRLLEQIKTGATYIRGKIGKRLAEGESIVCIAEIDGRERGAWIHGHSEEGVDLYKASYKKGAEDVDAHPITISLDQVKRLLVP